MHSPSTPWHLQLSLPHQALSIFSLLFPPVVKSSTGDSPLVGERPDPEVIPDVNPQAIEAFGFHDQEDDDQEDAEEAAIEVDVGEGIVSSIL